METAKLTKQILNYQKTAFENTFTGFSAFTTYSENVLDGFLRQFPWVTEEYCKPIYDSIEIMKTNRDDYKKLVDDGFSKLEELC